MTRVLQWRERRRLSAQEAAQLLDITVDEYRRLERGEATARSRGVHALQHESGLTLREIAGAARTDDLLLDEVEDADGERDIA